MSFNFQLNLAKEKDADAVPVLLHQIFREAENADWSYALIPDDVMSEWRRLMLAQFLEERENTASETRGTIMLSED